VTGDRTRPWFATAFGNHYPALYAHRDQAEAARCLTLLASLAPLGSGPVLDLGCGQGRHLRLLAARNVPTVGVDLSAALLRAARAESAELRLVRGDMRTLPLHDGCVTAVLSLFTAFGYFGTVQAHRPVVQEVARVLAPTGHWYLDFLDSERVADELAGGPITATRSLAGGALLAREERRLAVGPRRVVKTVHLIPQPGCEHEAAALGVAAGGLRYAEEVTLLSLAELDALAATAGLVRVAAAGDYDGSALVAGASERWLLVYARGGEG
jgi:SAM-dependent methyltransferase